MVNIRIIEWREQTIGKGLTVMLFPLPVSLLTEMDSNDGISNKAVQLRKVSNKICNNHIQHFIIELFFCKKNTS